MTYGGLRIRLVCDVSSILRPSANIGGSSDPIDRTFANKSLSRRELISVERFTLPPPTPLKTGPADLATSHKIAIRRRVFKAG